MNFEGCDGPVARVALSSVLNQNMYDVQVESALADCGLF